MLEVERNAYNSEVDCDSKMQLLSRNIFTQLATNAKQLSRLASANTLPQRYLLKSQSGVTTNLCSAQPQKSFSTDVEPTDANPQKLPHFPVPPLSETLQKFLKTAEVHLNENEYTATQRMLKEFETGVGAKLQALLEQTAKKERNWLATRWLKTAYMSYRDPVTIFSSPGMAFPTQQFKTTDEYLSYAAQVTYATLAYKELIDNKKLPVEKMGKQELDMSQYNKIFGTCRIPKTGEDYLTYNPKSKHFVVIHKNHFFKIPGFSQSGEPLSPSIFVKIFKNILESEDSMGPAIGLLTADYRDSWAEAYDELKNDFQNKQSLDCIHKALFVVCLDNEVPINHGENDLRVTSDQLIHGGGPGQNAGNRWMDKTIQIVVNRNGVNGLCYEHSPAEGQPIAIMTDYILNLVKSGKLVNAPINDSEYSPGTRLRFNVNDKINKYIEEAGKRVAKITSDLDNDVLHYTGYGKEFIKTQKLSPDSYIQMAMQYAFYKLHKTPAGQYESAHLRMYVDGRTETIRSCSTESARFARSMLTQCSEEERIANLRNAVKAHRDYTMIALQGKGVDRHLLGLKLMALENNFPVPDIYNSEAIKRSAHFRMSTSQVASKHLAYMCYGPLVDNGYGCCYNPRDNDMLFAISSWKSNPETSTAAFKRAMKESLDSMQELLARAGEKPKSKL